MSHWTIYHHPGCSKSRSALALLREHGIEPRVIEYRKTPLTAAELRALLARLQVPVRALIRSKEAAYAELGLDGALSDAALIDALAARPELMERPVVVAPDGAAAICRPPEAVLTLIRAA